MEHLPDYITEERPWGHFELFTRNEISSVKILTVKPNEAFSLQTHEHRAEFWKVLQGSGVITIGDTSHPAKIGDKFFASRGTPHRAQAGQEGLTLLEISIGDFNERDIIRLEDRYGRA
jgi:mannose-6-phosphate isomerase